MASSQIQSLVWNVKTIVQTQTTNIFTKKLRFPRISQNKCNCIAQPWNTGPPLKSFSFCLYLKLAKNTNLTPLIYSTIVFCPFSTFTIFTMNSNVCLEWQKCRLLEISGWQVNSINSHLGKQTSTVHHHLGFFGVLISGSVCVSL